MDRYESMLGEYIKDNVDKTLKEPAHYLKHPFVDPGSVYDGNLWDWDSFWAVYALLNMTESPSADHRYVKYAKGNIHNFFDHQLDDGYIPMMIAKDRYQEPYLIGKHKEGHVLNMHKPFLCQQIALISGYCNDYSWMESYYDHLEKYFACYDRNYFHDRSQLYVWADDVMIGVDNDPAIFGRPRFSTAGIYLNAFMVGECKAMSVIARKLGKLEESGRYKRKAEALCEAIQNECWDRRDRFYYSVDVDIKTRPYDWFHKGLGVFWNTLPIKIRSWSGFIPMYSCIASPEQAAFLVRDHIMDSNTFRSPFGVRTLARDEKMYDVRATNNPSNWLGPIWIVSNYVVFRGLMNYGYAAEAEELCGKTVELLGKDLERTGTLHEYYVPESGEPVMNGGFLNWNLLVVNMLDELNGKPPMSELFLS
ncbi:MGH1-like glycoside hydrolase domain-containing protein [Paenibacillus alkalitolerans]|uniref:MGH1-like glycoside hydrolase domain-containing protein n=1 Tax=Paenibacillus alkalitolerans TaxID=2799335 RepID=UPI0018F3BB3F|nr:trehalase family glycosidase [Paenibacillus alkalitolerans]